VERTKLIVQNVEPFGDVASVAIHPRHEDGIHRRSGLADELHEGVSPGTLLETFPTDSEVVKDADNLPALGLCEGLHCPALYPRTEGAGPSLFVILGLPDVEYDLLDSLQGVLWRGFYDRELFIDLSDKLYQGGCPRCTHPLFYQRKPI
jgi:hypothetical protein